MTQKFIDKDGLKVLWNQISLKDYPNNETLMAVIDAIDETKANKDEIVQADWNQTDENKLDFIKNKPFGEEYGTIYYLEEQIVNLEEQNDFYGDWIYIPLNDLVYINNKYIVVFDGVEYEATLYEEENGAFIGINYYYPSDNRDNLPFGLWFNEFESKDGEWGCSQLAAICTTDNSLMGEHTISIYAEGLSIHHLDPKYIKDMYYESPVEAAVVVEETTITLEEGAEPVGMLIATQPLEVGQEYTVTLDGATYNCICKFHEQAGTSYIGNLGLIGLGEDTGEMFFIAPMQSDTELGIVNATGALEYTVGVIGMITKVHQLDEKYLPDSFKKAVNQSAGLKVEGNVYIVNDNEVVAGVGAEIFNYYGRDDFYNLENIAIGDRSHAEGYSTTASGESSHAEGAKTTASGCQSHAEGYGTVASDYSHAEGNHTTASGDNSHAEGSGTTASGDNSHAEGGSTTASGYQSHAEGANTTASGNNSHAEGGGTTASGNNSHAEGYKTTASGNYSHAEGISINKLPDTITKDSTNEDIINTWKTTKFSLAKGEASHIEGYHTLALGDYSHAEGNHTTASGNISHAEGAKTTASGRYSHAEGQNTTASGEYQHVQGKYNIEDTDNKYAHIVGNGTADNARSNAHTVDWDGNAWYAGTVEATALILKSPNGTRFQITVGDDGVLTATEITE